MMDAHVHRDLDLWRRRFSRRELLRAGSLGAAGFLGGALVACRNGGNAPTPAAGGPAGATVGPIKRGGTFHSGSTIPIVTIDPHTDFSWGLVLFPYLYGYLMHDVGDPPRHLFDHALSLEQPDDATFVFKLRQGIRFHDVEPVFGRELTSEDVVYSLNRLASLTYGTSGFWRLWVESIANPDRDTVVVKTKGPFAYTLDEVGSVRTAIVAREVVEKFGDLRTREAGSGPFVMTSFSAGESLEAVRHPAYYREGIPYLDGFATRVIPDEASLEAAFRAGAMDIYTPPNKPKADALAKDRADIVVTEAPSAAYRVFILNPLTFQPFQDIRVREAFDVALDRQGMVDKLAFGAGKVCGPVPWALDFWALPQDELEAFYEHNPAKAKQLLSAAGFEGLEVELKYPTGQDDLAAVIQDNLSEAGVGVKLVPRELGTWLAEFFVGDFETTAYTQLPYDSEFLPLQYHHSQNVTRQMEPVLPPDEELDNLLDEMLHTLDVNQRRELGLEAQRCILRRRGPMLSLYAFLAEYRYVRGYEAQREDLGLYNYEVWLDK
jgi:peptide/nickel transport system substrate-binding protein